MRKVVIAGIAAAVVLASWMVDAQQQDIRRGGGGGGGTSWPVTNSGVVLQERVYPYTNMFSTTSVIPTDSTIPTSSEGAPIWTNSITPLSTNSYFHISLAFTTAGSGSLNTAVTLFKNAETDAFGGGITALPSGAFASLVGNGYVTNTSLTPVTITANFGVSSGTGYINRNNGASVTNTFGGRISSAIVIKEIQL